MWLKMAIGFKNQQEQPTLMLFERDQQLLYELLIKLKTCYERNTPAVETASFLFFSNEKKYWDLVKKMQDYKINVFNKGGRGALNFVQNVFSVFDEISRNRNLNLNDLIIGMKLIYKTQLEDAESKSSDSSEFTGLFDEPCPYG